MMPVRHQHVIDVVNVGVHASGGDFVQQRLPQVRRQSIDERHRRAPLAPERVAEPRRERKTRRAAADDDDPVRLRCRNGHSRRAAVGARVNRPGPCLRAADRRRRSSRPSCARSPAVRSSARSRASRGRAPATSARAPPPHAPLSSSVGPLRLPKFGSAIAACGSSPQSSTPIERFRDVVDDRAAAGRSDDHVDPAGAVVDDRRRHRRARPLPGLDAVGDGLAVLARNEREIGQLVVEQKTALGHQAAAEIVLDRRGHRDRVAVGVDDRDVRGRRKLVRVIRPRRLSSVLQCRDGVPGVARPRLASARIARERSAR